MKRFDPYTQSWCTHEQYLEYNSVFKDFKDNFYDLEHVKAIERIDSHTYKVPVFGISPAGLEFCGWDITPFLKGSKDGMIQPGLLTETLIQLCITHLESVNVGDLQSDHTTAAIAHLMTANEILAERQKDREKRGVAQTYQK